MMISKEDSRYCDICGTANTCFYCGKRNVDAKEVKTLSIMDVIARPHVMVAVDMTNDGHVKTHKITKEQIADIGEAYCSEVIDTTTFETVWGIPDMPVSKLFDIKVDDIKKTKTLFGTNGISTIYIGLIYDNIA